MENETNNMHIPYTNIEVVENQNSQIYTSGMIYSSSHKWNEE